MRRTIIGVIVLIGSSLAAALLLTVPASAHDFRVGDLIIGHPWTRAVTPRAPTAAGYMAIHNTGRVADRLIAAETPQASQVDLHETSMTDGIMRMRPIPRGIDILPGQEVLLAPSGLHLMLISPRGTFTQGARVPLTLVFEQAGRVDVELAVEAPGARGAGHAGH